MIEEEVVPSVDSVASKAKGLLLTKEVKQAFDEEVVAKIDQSMVDQVFGLMSAAMIAVSAYAYIV